MAEELGSGIQLDGNWDMIITSTGDLDAAEGDDELEKDLALFTAVELQERVGRPITKNGLRKAELAVSQQAQEDPRIEKVQEVEAVKSGEDQFTVRLTVLTVEGTVENIEVSG